MVGELRVKLQCCAGDERALWNGVRRGAGLKKAMGEKKVKRESRGTGPDEAWTKI
jgi:hypothetical protein